MKIQEYWNPLVPELTVTNLAVSMRFYAAAGFRVRFQREDPPFAYVELGQAQLMLEQQHVDGWNIEPLDRPLGRGINFQIEVPDVDTVCTALVRIGAVPWREVKETWYQVFASDEEGQREFLIQDPDGYLLRFAEYLGRRRIE